MIFLLETRREPQQLTRDRDFVGELLNAVASLPSTSIAVLLASLNQAEGQTSIVSVVPPTGTSGVSPTDPDGTATSVTIPAGTLTPGRTYTASVVFSHAILATNGIDATYVYRATDTKFSLVTLDANFTPPTLTNFVWSEGTLGFDVVASPG